MKCSAYLRKPSVQFISSPKTSPTSFFWVILGNVILAESRNGEAIRVLYVAQDVTESKQKEERERNMLKEACDAANHANASKSEFLSRMSHDIRTPMNAIIGMTSIAGAHLDDRDNLTDPGIFRPAEGFEDLLQKLRRHTDPAVLHAEFITSVIKHGRFFLRYPTV